MKRIYLILFFCFIWPQFSAADPGIPQKPLSTDLLAVSFKGARIVDVRVPENAGMDKALQIDFELHNSSDHRKLDIVHVPLAAVTDEFQNQYRLLKGCGFSGCVLYPGQKKLFSLLFELPVEAAQEFVVSFDGPFLDSGDSFSIGFSREGILADQGSLAEAAIAPVENEAERDFNIQYPLNHQAFHPGEKVFVQIGLADIAAHPSKIHVLAFDNFFTDDQAVGRYEIRVPEKAQYESNVPVVIMIEWDSGGPDPDIISKTVSISIVPKSS